METAIVLPLFTFILLGILQIMLMHQARLMTRYAAFKAVRAGSIGSANKKRMTNAALSVLIPLIAKGANGAGHATGKSYHVTSSSDFTSAFDEVKDNNNSDANLPYVEVMICSPNKSLLNNAGDEMDFDGKDTITNQDWKGFDKSRLSIQVTFNYRMVVPFANMMIWHMAYGEDNMDLYRTYRLGLQPRELSQRAQGGADSKYNTGHENGVYIFPIRANWAMRMQSNLFPNAGGDYELPSGNDCVVRFKQSDDGGGGASGQVNHR